VEELVGKTIAGRYRVDGLMAMGGMGAVFRAHHLLLQKRVAIKILRPDTEDLDKLVIRFEREAIAGAHIVHPNVAAATDFGHLEDGSCFLVLEYVGGETLHGIVSRGRLPVRRAVRIARQIAAALAAAHGMGIIHRDVKTGNVMVLEDQDDLVKLIDFGLSKVPVKRVVAVEAERSSAPPSEERWPPRDSLEPASCLTAVGMIFGTVAYLAPEAALGMTKIDERSDLYALGIILYEMLIGVRPFASEEPAALFSQQRFRPPPSFAEAAPGVALPAALEAVVMRLLAKDPDERFASATDLIAALDALDLRAASARPPEPRGPAPSAERPTPVPGSSARAVPCPISSRWATSPAPGPHAARPRWQLPLVIGALVLGTVTATYLVGSEIDLRPAEGAPPAP
jgi:serine/threonine-protein kinase